MHAGTGTAIDTASAWEHLFGVPVPAKVRTSTDRPRPFSGRTASASRRQSSTRERTQTTISSDEQRNAKTSAPIGVAEIDRTFFDPWFSETMGILSTARDAVASKSNQAKQTIDTAELLAAFLVEVQSGRRPQLMVDEDGCASYGTSIEGFYINLTIETPSTLSWYAVVGDDEIFEDSVPFSGRSIPDSLRDIFKLRIT